MGGEGFNLNTSRDFSQRNWTWSLQWCFREAVITFCLTPRPPPHLPSPWGFVAKDKMIHLVLTQDCKIRWFSAFCGLLFGITQWMFCLSRSNVVSTHTKDIHIMLALWLICQCVCTSLTVHFQQKYSMEILHLGTTENFPPSYVFSWTFRNLCFSYIFLLCCRTSFCLR